MKVSGGGPPETFQRRVQGAEERAGAVQRRPRALDAAVPHAGTGEGVGATGRGGRVGEAVARKAGSVHCWCASTLYLNSSNK